MCMHRSVVYEEVSTRMIMLMVVRNREGLIRSGYTHLVVQVCVHLLLIKRCFCKERLVLQCTNHKDEGGGGGGGEGGGR